MYGLRHKYTIMVSVFVIIFLVILANITNFSFLKAEAIYEPTYFNQTINLSMADKSDHLMWFLQISDIHISAFNDPSRITDFKDFCENALKVFKPSVVIASGDLTDGKAANKLTSQEIQKEWVEYQNILSSLNITQHTTWLDIKGNHDNFNLIDLKSKENYFENYSVQGKTNPRSYLYQLKKNGDIYSFIAVDTTLQPGPRFPFNFIGLLDDDEVKVINNIVHQIESSNSNYTIWFGHYPTSCIISHEPNEIRPLIGKHSNGLAYLCGHLHRIVPEMYTLHPEGFLELELSDWKKNRMYRLLAVDHGLLSFIDVKHRDWPVILITNPKHALFLIPYKHDLDVIRQSTHIRLLVFSQVLIEFVKIQIDSQTWTFCQHIDGPLYVAPWDPNAYSTGLHKIKVHVEDVQGRSKYHTQPFSLDGTTLSFGVLPSFVLKTSANTIFKLMFWILNIIILTPLLLLKLVHYRHIARGNNEERKSSTTCTRTCFRKLWNLVSVDRIFWPLVLYQIYLTVGPWTIGYMIENYIGAIFAWGIYVNGVFLPASVTYIYGFMQLLLFQIPLIFVLAHGVDHRIQLYLENGEVSWLSKIRLHVPFIAILTLQFIMVYCVLIGYGILACLICPLHTWATILAIMLWVQALSLLKQHAL
ncbi:hypothetical protein RI129_007169 [Pyrocoelia pectoralis]|uniref:Calcineurin-like phosphoesterase domain-containing protein n=1 Tax=Pyrocoelia pectoralis TaxID=417401 RepID=A0AAN7VHG5_9COLE